MKPHINPKTMQILHRIREKNGKAFIVGGFVRDFLMGFPNKDIDIEVFGLTLQQLKNVISNHSKKFDEVGESFGILKVDMSGVGGDDLEFSLPRRDSKQGTGHKGFVVETDSGMTIEEAGARRDFTINSMSYDVLNDKIIDIYNGQNDINNKIIRHTSPAYSEDPLRVLRGMQFGARFGFSMHPAAITITFALISSIFPVHVFLHLIPEATTFPLPSFSVKIFVTNVLG